jgi:hypothetical protein
LCRESLVVCNEGIFDTFLAIAIDNPQKRAANRKVWVALALFNDQLRLPLNNPEDAGERLGKSIRVQDAAVLYVEEFCSCVGEALATLYMHLGMRHILDIIRVHPIDISDLSQQYVEAALKQGKSDMQNFTNKRLRDERQDKGRNYQVMGKDRERVALKRTVPMPLTRNEKRYLGDGSKAAQQTVERAARRGQLISRSGAQLNKRLEKTQLELHKLVAHVQEQRALTLLGAPANLINPSSSTAEGSGALGGAAATEFEARRGGVAPRGRGRGRGTTALAPAPAAAAAAARGGGGAPRARGRGRGRARPASARDL